VKSYICCWCWHRNNFSLQGIAFGLPGFRLAMSQT
jgi:hypothetical protein